MSNTNLIHTEIRNYVAEWQKQNPYIPITNVVLKNVSNETSLESVKNHLSNLEHILNISHHVPPGSSYSAMMKKFLENPMKWL